jgi:hypothetical protein
VSMSIPISTDDRSRRLGAEYAIAMMHELREVNGVCLEGKDVEGDFRQDPTVVLRYLRELSPDQIEGFAAILTDFIGNALQVGAPDVQLYEEMLAEGRI